MTPNHFDVLAHIEGMGDMHAGPGEYAGTRGKTKFMEGFAITFDEPHEGLGLRYRAQIRGQGDTGWVRDGRFAGTRGKDWPVVGFHIELTGSRMSLYDVFYMTHVRNSGDTPWFSNGQFCGFGEGNPVEGLAVRIVQRKPEYITLTSRETSRSGYPLLITAPNLHDDMNVRVSRQNGGDTQLWDRRAVRGGNGYALISKAHPHLCIARGSGRDVVLKDVVFIATDDHCVWHDDTVPGMWNAIYSETDRELKLNMRGDRPYADEDNALIVHPWSKAAWNELWLHKTMSYDLVGGFDVATLDGIAQTIYTACYPRIFKGVRRIEDAGIDTLSYDIVTAPVFRFDPAELQHAVEAPAGTERQMAVWIERIELAIEGSWPPQAQGSLEMVAKLALSDDRRLTLRAVQGKLRLGMPDPGLEHVLDRLFVPWLLDALNEQILDRLALPIGLHGAFTRPWLSVQHPHVLITTSGQPDQAVAPPFAPWPHGRTFAAADEHALGLLLAPALDAIRPLRRWEYEVALGDCRLKLDGEYWARFAQPRFRLLSAAERLYRVEFDLVAGGSFNGSCGDWSGYPTAGANRHVSGIVRLAVERDDLVIAVFHALDDFSLDWTMQGLPDKARGVTGKILDALNAAVIADVRRTLQHRVLPLLAIADIRAPIAHREFRIALRDVALDVMADPEGKLLAMLSGVTDVSVVG